MSGYIIIWVLIASTIASMVSFVATPKGVNQTVIRNMIVMSITCCYLMWSITYLAQLHPLINPIRVGLRPHYE